MDIDIKIRENGDISWLKNEYEQFKNKDSFNEDDILLYRELLGHGGECTNCSMSTFDYV